ncbi:MAG: pyruvate kinase [Verrucomicrobiales bacterium]
MDIPENRQSLTKIIATLGPASANEATLAELIRMGVSVFRINFSHGTFEEFERMLKLVRRVADELGRHIGVMGDLSGPKVRIGKVIDGGVTLAPGQEVRFVKPIRITDAAQPLTFSTTCPEVLNEIQPNEPILLDDGALRLRCVSTAGSGVDKMVTAMVEVGGILTSSKGMNLPETTLTLPALTKYDVTCLNFVVAQRFDFVSLSFVKNAQDVRDLKEMLRTLGARPRAYSVSDGAPTSAFTSDGATVFIPVISKIEKPQAIDALEEIVSETDVVMVARGDLGVEMDLAQVPVIQKRIISECNNQGKPVIVATQMLQSMIESPSATRAEVSDVANAIFDGADAVMLSGETAVGKYPVEAVKILRKVGLYTHRQRREDPDHWSLPAKPRASKYRTAALARGVGAVLRELDAPIVAIWSSHGGGASYLSQLRLPLPVVAFSEDPAALRRMSIMFGIWPICKPMPELTTTFIREIDELLLAQDWAKAGDPIVVVMGQPIGRSGLTNDLRIHYVGDQIDTAL